MNKTLNVVFLIILSSFSNSNNTVKDIDGNIYKTTKIGTQTWMCSNLNVSHFKNGDLIRQAKAKSDWNRGIKNKTPMWCYYDFDAKNGIKQGKLYNFWAIVDKRGLAPAGWLIPNLEHWKNLDYFLGKQFTGRKLKATSFNGTDNYEFNIKGTGGISENGFYPTALENGFFASSTEDIRNNFNNHRYFYIVIFGLDFDQITYASYGLDDGVAVRCLKD